MIELVSVDKVKKIRKQKQKEEGVKKMKKFKNVIIAAGIVGALLVPREAHADKVTYWTFKATNEHNLMDMTYTGSCELSKNPLKVGAYYKVKYDGDWVQSAKVYKPSKAQKIKLDKKYKKMKKTVCKGQYSF